MAGTPPPATELAEPGKSTPRTIEFESVIEALPGLPLFTELETPTVLVPPALAIVR